MLLTILTYGEPTLREVAEPVTVFDLSLEKLAADMVDTMYAASGIGLAAPQIGISKRLIVVDIQEGGIRGQVYVVINPVILETGGEMVRREEGCLSVPELNEDVTRPTHAVIGGLDLKGQSIQIHADDLLARCFLHEIDHLDGILFVDRVSGFRKTLLNGKLKRHFGVTSNPLHPPSSQTSVR